MTDYLVFENNNINKLILFLNFPYLPREEVKNVQESKKYLHVQTEGFWTK